MSIPELLKLSRSEKLKIVEALWEDLSAEPDALESPSWHGNELAATDRDYESGKVEVLDWDEAKQKLTSSTA